MGNSLQRLSEGDFAFAETEKSFEIFSLPVDLQWFFDDVRRRYHNPIEQGLKHGHQHHPEVGADEYGLAQRIIDEGEIYQQGDGRLIALWKRDGVLYRAAIKRTGDRSRNYWLTLFRTTEEKADEEVRNRYRRIR